MQAHHRAPSAFAAPIAEQIWDMKYRLKTDGGGVSGGARFKEASVQQTWRRVARALAAAEAPEKRALWEDRFYRALEGFQFLPAGRVLAGAGADRSVTLFNCFVMGTIPDDLPGIFEMLKEAAVTMQHGGGIGYDFSTIRPKGARVEGVGADASGPVSFMDVWDAMCRTIMSAGSRRGAMMATLACDHPDIEGFIAAKADPQRLRNFNLSVLVSDAFMEAVATDAPWRLVFEGRTYKTLPARALWDQIMRATYDYAEPGVIFIDRINARNNLWYCETINATNPCVTADCWVHTADGPRQVADLIGRPFDAFVNGARHRSGPEGFFATGVKNTVRLATACGRSLRLTKDHRLLAVARKTRWRIETEWREAGSLKPGDEVMIHDHLDAVWGPTSQTDGDLDRGYLIGLLVGDGVLKKDKAVLSVWSAARTACGCPTPGPAAVMRRAEAAVRRLPHRADFDGWREIADRNEWRLATAALRRLALELGLTPGAKSVTAEIERRSSPFQIGFLQGFFDSDGSVQGAQEKGVSVRLSQSDLNRLQAVQRMLGRLGINSAIYRERRRAGAQRLPDGKGGEREYQTQANHELVISGANIARFAERIGFQDVEKAARLMNALGAYKRSLNRERFTAVVESIEPDEEAEVFDAQIPGINRFDANGFVAHNCGEQPLPPYGACLLGSINLARLVEEPFTAQARIDRRRLEDLVGVSVRMMDNVIDVSRFALEAQSQEARAKRRIGLGVTGLADALAMQGMIYGEDEAIAQTEDWMKSVQDAAYRASVEIAREKGAFPLYDREHFLAGETIQALDPEIRAGIAEYGIRNALLTSIAPTGTISLYAGNVSSGVEPIFAHSYTRKVSMPDGTKREEEVVDYAVARFRESHGPDAPLPPAFVSAQTLDPLAHLRMQAAAQKHIDSAISKTINMPADIPFEAFKEVYRIAYDSGCKGCTTYRPNAITGSVLSTGDAPEQPAEARSAPTAPAAEAAAGAGFDTDFDASAAQPLTDPLNRPEALPGATYKLKWPGSPHALYITVNDVMIDGRRRPFELFINSKNMEHYAWTVALTRMISAVFRRGGDVSFVVEELKAVFDPRGGAWVKGAYVPSILAAIGGVIERHMIDIGFLKPGAALSGDPVYSDAAAGEKSEAEPLARQDPEDGAPAAGACPQCGAFALRRAEGCAVCGECGYSECG